MPSALQSPQKQKANITPLTRNVDRVVLGSIWIDAWYPSFYPREQVGSEHVKVLCVCQWCFKYTPEIVKYHAHQKVCPMKDALPTGRMIYKKDEFTIHKIDGEEHKLYAQNLSLFAKLFLDTKSVFFDVSSFLYYTLVLHSDDGQSQVIGFFSKEKMSWDNNNVACILIFPPWQRRGLGQILMSASYELGRREGRFGGPERPLSALGKKGYTAFWCGEVSRYILGCSNKKTVSIKDISEATWILPDDIITALQEMDVHEKRKTGSGSLVVNKSRVQAWASKHGIDNKALVDVNAFLPEVEEELYIYDEDDE